MTRRKSKVREEKTYHVWLHSKDRSKQSDHAITISGSKRKFYDDDEVAIATIIILRGVHKKPKKGRK